MSRLQPRPKALATSNISSQSATGNREPISKTETPASRQNVRVPLTDALSERATLFLIRRTLCSQLGDKGRSTPAPIDEILPPLTSSNEVDLQLYALIAIIIREFVQTWYGKITPDQVFVEEVVKIIAHCTRALEQRLRNVDLESLLFDELPELLEVHIQGA
jgi:PXA domain-containing protein